MESDDSATWEDWEDAYPWLIEAEKLLEKEEIEEERFEVLFYTHPTIN